MRRASGKNCRAFLKKCALSPAILNFSYSRVFIRARRLAGAFLTLALRDRPRWIIAEYLSRARGDTSEMLSPSCFSFLHTQNAPHEFFENVAREKFSGLTTNRRICEGGRDTRCVCAPRRKREEEEEEEKKGEESAESTRARPRVMEILRDFLGCVPSRYRPPSV